MRAAQKRRQIGARKFFELSGRNDAVGVAREHMILGSANRKERARTMLAPTSNRSRSNRSPYDPPNMGDAGYSPSMTPAAADGAYAPPSAGSSSTGGGNMPPPNFYSGAYAPPNGPRLEADTAKITAPMMD